MAFLTFLALLHFMPIVAIMLKRLDSCSDFKCSRKRWKQFASLVYDFLLRPLLNIEGHPLISFVLSLLGDRLCFILLGESLETSRKRADRVLHGFDVVSLISRFFSLPSRLTIIKTMAETVSPWTGFVVYSPMEWGLLCVTSFVIAYLTK